MVKEKFSLSLPTVNCYAENITSLLLEKGWCKVPKQVL